MKEIEDRLNARAGNPDFSHSSPQSQSFPRRQESPAEVNKKEEKKVEKGKAFGTGISEDDIKKIIHNFTR